MKHRTSVFLVLLAFVFCLPASGAGPGDDDDAGARGWFIRTRPKTRTKAKPKAKPATVAAVKPAAKPSTDPQPEPSTERIGIGYSLFKEGALGKAVRVDPSRTFKVGDNLRLVLEPNIDGYVYVFYTENGKNPTMIFPDARLSAGANDVEGHTIVEIPSSQDPRYQWFKIAGEPAVERIYVVVTREPLPGVPVGNELVNYCQTFTKNCPWKPSEDLWLAIKDMANTPVVVDAKRDEGEELTGAEQDARSRDLLLSAGDAQPSVVTVTSSTQSKAVMSIVDIKHE